MTKTANPKMNSKKEENDDFHFEILNHIGVLGTNNAGWRKELNVVKWNDANPKLDIREWDTDHEKMSRGASLNPKEAEKLRELLTDYDFSTMILG